MIPTPPASTAGGSGWHCVLLALALLLLLLALVAPASAQLALTSLAPQAVYTTLLAWKRATIFSDPSNFTSNWVSPNVCAYNGIYCAPRPSNGVLVMVGIDLNHADIAGHIPANLPLGLPDLALVHLNSNRFCGVLFDTFLRLQLLHKLDLSNNRFVGTFPAAVLGLPILGNLGNSPASVIVLVHNRLGGCIPPSIGRMADTLNEIMLIDDDLTS
jgi:hypothetical protein